MIDKTPSNFAIWSRLKKGDLIFTAEITDKEQSLYMLRVATLGVTGSDPEVARTGFVIYVDECHQSDGIRVALSTMQTLSYPGEIDSTTASELVKSCRREVQIGPVKHDADVLPIPLPQGYSFRVAADSASVEFLDRCAITHPFGRRQDGLALVLEKNDELIGGAVIQMGALTNQYHRMERIIFGSSLNYLKDSSIHVSRLLSKYRYLRRHAIYQRVISAVLLLSEHLFDKPVTFVSGVSYDLIPGAYRSGARIAIPDDAYGALYYWKSFVPEATIPLTEGEYADIRKHFRSMLDVRRQSGSWIAFGSPVDLEKSLKHKMWLLSDGRAQKAKWHSIRLGDHLFLANRNGKLVAIGSVAKKYRQKVSGYERYPLAISFSKLFEVDNVSSAELSSIISWLRFNKTGGITAIPTDIALEIRNYFQRKIARSHMWVTPNPTLLHGTNFTTSRKQIFVVQSWDLRESVLPVIRVVCMKYGYSVVHSEDRHGQVIFDPIWRMLNEAEVIIVDFTDKRPNVYLEYGMALVLGKPIVAITQSEKDVPSDTPNLKWHKYRGVAPLPDLDKILPPAIAGTVADVEATRRSIRDGMM